MMAKILNPCTCRAGKTGANAFVKIEYDGGRLSISGVIGPMKNGDSCGNAGQCVDEIRNGTPAKGWTREKLNRFCDIWERWHLNDMRPECEHQRELGWRDMAKEQVTLYHYMLTREASDAKKTTEKAALSALREGKTFTPTRRQAFYANLPYGLDTCEPLDGKESALYYEPKKDDFMGSFMEEKTRGWIRFNEAELGLLCKPCPVCGYRYGTAWKREEVPQEILDQCH